MNRINLLAFLGLLAVITALVLLYFKPWQRGLYDQFADHPRAQFPERPEGEYKLLDTAALAYNAEDYEKALFYFSKLLDVRPDDVGAYFYRGICYLELGQHEEAARHFEILHKSPSIYKPAGTWYLALTYLKMGEAGQAEVYARGVPDGSKYYASAQKMLIELKSEGMKE